MNKRWQVLGICAFLAIAWNLSGCKKASVSTGGSLFQYIPRENRGVLFVQKLGAIPTQLNAMLGNYEGTEGPIRTYIQGLKGRVGIDPLELAAIAKGGLAADGSLLGCRARIKGRKAGVLAISIKDASKFEAWLKGFLRERLLASQFTDTPQKGAKITTAFRVNKQKQSIELLSYTIQNRQAVLVWSFAEEKPGQPAHTADTLGHILKQDAKESLQTDKAFQKALNRSGKKSQVMIYVPENTGKVETKTAEFKAEEAKLKKRLAKMQRTNPLLGRLPIGMLGSLMNGNPLKGGSSTLSFGPAGVQLNTTLPVPQVAMASLQSAIPTAGNAVNLLEALHQDGILTLKLGVRPALLETMLPQVAARLKRTPEQLDALLKQHTGLALRDVFAAATGRAYLTLYKVNMEAMQKVVGGDMFSLLNTFEFAIVAELNDAKILERILKTLSSTLKIGGKGVTSHKEEGGITRYSIPAWPGTVAHWAHVGKFFVYGLGESAFRKVLAAIQSPPQRMFANAAVAGSLAENGSSALHINLDNLRALLSALPLGQRLVVAMVVASYNLQKLRSLTLSAKPGQDFLTLQASLQLKHAKGEK